MANLNLVNTKYSIEMLRKHGVSNGCTIGFRAGWCDIAADQLEAALALIKELTEENERLEDNLIKQSTENIMLLMDKQKIKSDTVRKMQERLKAKKFTHKNLGELVYVEDIDQIVNEILEGK